MQLVHVSRWNLSHVRVRVRSVRAASSHSAAESRLTSNGKHIVQNQCPQLLCVLLVQRIYAIDLAHDATVGERSRNSKFSTQHQDQSMEKPATRGKRVHLHTLVDR